MKEVMDPWGEVADLRPGGLRLDFNPRRKSLYLMHLACWLDEVDEPLGNCKSRRCAWISFHLIISLDRTVVHCIAQLSSVAIKSNWTQPEIRTVTKTAGEA